MPIALAATVSGLPLHPLAVHVPVVLLPLGAAMTMLACCYLAAQYLVALHHARFIAILVAAVVTEITVLAVIGGDYVQVAVVVLCVQAVAMLGVVGLATRAKPRGRIDPVPA